jgi:hypothetical protein
MFDEHEGLESGEVRAAVAERTAPDSRWTFLAVRRIPLQVSYYLLACLLVF